MSMYCIHPNSVGVMNMASMRADMIGWVVMDSYWHIMCTKFACSVQLVHSMRATWTVERRLLSNWGRGDMLTHHTGGGHNRLCRSSCHRMSQKTLHTTGCGIYQLVESEKLENTEIIFWQNRLCGFFCVRGFQPKFWGGGYSILICWRVRNYSVSTGFVVRVQQWLGDLAVVISSGQPVGESSTSKWTRYIYGAHHAGGIELRHCDVSPGDVVWEGIPEGPLRYCTLHATLVYT